MQASGFLTVNTRKKYQIWGDYTSPTQPGPKPIWKNLLRCPKQLLLTTLYPIKIISRVVKIVSGFLTISGTVTQNIITLYFPHMIFNTHVARNCTPHSPSALLVCNIICNANYLCEMNVSELNIQGTSYVGAEGWRDTKPVCWKKCVELIWAFCI